MSGATKPTEETPHMIAVRRQWRLNRLAAERRTGVRPADDLEAVLERARAEEAVRNPRIGQFVPGKGVFSGIWAPKDGNGVSLGKIFNVYAARQDISDASGIQSAFNYNEAQSRVAGIKGLYGHDGGDFANDTALYEALRRDEYKGEWFIPTPDILSGCNVEGQTVQCGNLYQNRFEGEFVETFTTYPSDSTASCMYWSCTENRDNPSIVWLGRFESGGGNYWSEKNDLKASTRPVRLELRRPVI